MLLLFESDVEARDDSDVEARDDYGANPNNKLACKTCVYNLLVLDSHLHFKLLVFVRQSPDWPMENRPGRSVTLLGGRSDTSTLFGSDFYGYNFQNETMRYPRTGKNAQAAKLLLVLKFSTEIFLSFVVLLCSVFSKLTLVGLTNHLGHAAALVRNNTTTISSSDIASEAASLYWQLLLILMIPNCLTIVRCLVFGFIGKSNNNFPFPSTKSTIVGWVVTTVEVLAISTLIFLVLTELSPGIGILTLSGIFITQIFANVVESDFVKHVLSFSRRSRFMPQPSSKNSPANCKSCFNMSTKLLAFLLQITGLVGVIGYFIYAATLRGSAIRYQLVIGLPVAIIALSITWTKKVQSFISESSVEGVSARYKSSFLNSLLRLVLYPFLTYILFRYASVFQNMVDPWCLHNSCDLNLSAHSVTPMVVHVLSGLLGYFTVWISCTMTINQFSLGLSLLLSTPIAGAIFYASKYFAILHNFHSYFFAEISTEELLYSVPVPVIFAFLLWAGEVLAMGYFICTKKNLILAQDCDMFLKPHYNSAFLEQHIILNRQISIPNENNNHFKRNDFTKPRTIFICSTMYRENTTEMEQMLTSIYRVAESFGGKHPFWKNCEIESHIFMDGAINGTQIEGFGLQLLSLVEKAFKVNLKHCSSLMKIRTPYGYRISMEIGPMQLKLPFNIHFKDKHLVKPKKRWSQVMYMNYVINYRIKEKSLDPNNTFILTTDADIDFTANSAIVLLDMLASDDKVAAVCARTHPKGHGPLYWYQIFDYAIGHWLQKSTEHILGSVLCVPGCFSTYRCSALSKVLKEYSSEVEGGIDFLKKDMGEDRWLCTLLIKKGLRFEYCAISENHTYCPVDFDEFYKQRRRWIPSTVANLMMLITEASTITMRNDSISVLFIFYQILLMFSTAIAPATVILVIAAGFENYEFAPSSTITITLLVFVALVYGAVCLYASPKTQLDVAKLLSFLFAILMILVFIGIFKSVIEEFIPPASSDSDLILPTSLTTESLQETNDTSTPFELPVGISTLYIGVLLALFPFAAICHLPEWHCILHGVWLLLGLPAGYLLLPIYSAANLCDRSWGTREQHNGEDEGLWGWRRYPIMLWQFLHNIISKCCLNKKKEKSVDFENVSLLSSAESESRQGTVDAESLYGDMSVTFEDQSEKLGYSSTPLDKYALQWLKEYKAERYAACFEIHGYTSKHFIADMKAKDLEAIGIDQLGFKLKLERAVKLLPPLHIDIQVPTNIATWLKMVEMPEYTALLNDAGYETEEDMVNLKRLDEKELRMMGITKRAHLRRFQNAIQNLKKPSGADQMKRRVKGIIDSLESFRLNDEESIFWKNLIAEKLKPVSAQFTSTNEIHNSLKSLRNATLVLLFFINISWLILLGYFSFQQLERYNIDPRAVQIVFLGIFGILLAVQTLAMLAHRGVTLIHYLGRL